MEKHNFKSHLAENNIQSTTQLIDRLEQLGYQCQSERCDHFTTLRIRPMDEKTKPKDEKSEIVFDSSLIHYNN